TTRRGVGGGTTSRSSKSTLTRPAAAAATRPRYTAPLPSATDTASPRRTRRTVARCRASAPVTTARAPATSSGLTKTCRPAGPALGAEGLAETAEQPAAPRSGVSEVLAPQCGELAQQRRLLLGQAGRRLHAAVDVEVAARAAAVELRHAVAAQREDVAGLGPGRDAQLRLAVQGR